MATTIKLKRGTRTNLDSLATSSSLVAGEPILITDEDRLAVATGVSTYETFAKVSEVDDGLTPYIGINGNWWIGDVDQNIKAEGVDGISPTIGLNGNWYLGETDTGVKAQATGAYEIYLTGGGTLSEVDFNESITDIPAHIEDATKHIDTTTAEFSGAIDETNDKFTIWDNSLLKWIRFSFTSLKTYLNGIYHKFGGSSFGAKQIIGSIDNQDFGIITNNTERLTVLKDGKVGIATTAPNQMLNILGNLSITGADKKLIVERNNGSNTNFVNLWVGVALALFQYPSVLKFGIQAASSQADNGMVGYSMMSFGNSRNTMFGDMLASQADLGPRLTVKGETSDSTKAALSIINSYDTNLLYVRNDGNVGISTTYPKSKLQVAGGIQCGDDTAAASADKVGATRYRATANASYVEMCMQVGASSYSWVAIVTNTW